MDRRRPVRPLLYLWSRRQRIRLVRLIEAVFTGVWLGLLTRRDLDVVDDEYYVGRAKQGPIDFESPAYNRAGLFAWELEAVSGHFPTAGALGLLGAGGGREVMALKGMGYDVEAWECQPALVHLANNILEEAGFEGAVRFAARDTIPSGAGPYDGFIIGWGAYTLVPGRDRRIALLQDIRRTLAADAPLLISFFDRTGREFRFRFAARVANVIRRVRRVELSEPGDYLDPNYVHLFTGPEIASELAKGGFEVVHAVARPYAHVIARAR